MVVLRVIIVDDHVLVRKSLHALLKRATDLEVVGEADNGETALELVPILQPDLVLLDISMPRMDGITAAGHILKMPALPIIIIISMYADSSLTKRALDIGVQGVLLKERMTEELLPAIRGVCQGDTIISVDLKALPGLARQLTPDVKAVIL